MTEIIGVRFKRVGKVYYFDPVGLQFAKGQPVVVETARGIELGEIAIPNKTVEDSSVVSPLKPVIRAATPQDLEHLRDNEKKEKEAFDICTQKIEEHKLDMKLVDAEYTFDNNKVLFYFTSEGRVDFRELVKDLASIFRTRIELRQIGVRDEAKMRGGLGICGKPFCCASFLGEFQPVSIKMAKEQSLSLNPTKISGTCGRLMCCLKYEQEAYEDLLAKTPRVGARVETPDFTGIVTEVSLLRGMVKVRPENGGNGELLPRSYHFSQLSLIGRPDPDEDELLPEEIPEDESFPDSLDDTENEAIQEDNTDIPDSAPLSDSAERPAGKRGGRGRRGGRARRKGGQNQAPSQDSAQGGGGAGP